MKDFLKSLLKKIDSNATSIYLTLASTLILFFSIWFCNIGLFPMKNLADFIILAVFLFILSLYRTGWTFLFFLSALVLENINIAPEILKISIRPYQILAFFVLFSIIIRALVKKGILGFPNFFWIDYLFILFGLSGFLSAIFSIQRTGSFKQAIVSCSFVAIYFLVRMYIQTVDDFRRIAGFFFSAGILVTIYSIWQSIAFSRGISAFEVMPGRPNGTFSEADWLGAYLVFLLSTFLSIIYVKNKKLKNYNLEIIGYWLVVSLVWIALILTVSRSAWLGAVAVVVVFLSLILFEGTLKSISLNWKKVFIAFANILLSFLLSLIIVLIFHLTTFQLFNRAQSTSSGMQKITISCLAGYDDIIPLQINDIGELENYHCRHINLEEISKEKNNGNLIMEVYRPDPNVGIRAKIYKKSLEEIKNHPIFGIGWGNIGTILGQDERGAGLNASNIFLEIWLGTGIVGLVSFLIVLGYIFIKSVKMFFKGIAEKKNIAVFLILGFFAIIIPNLFNSGIFLGFLWLYLGISVSMLTNEKKS
jgi:hypothetical protein